jgi:hypothetical protein
MVDDWIIPCQAEYGNPMDTGTTYSPQQAQVRPRHTEQWAMGKTCPCLPVEAIAVASCAELMKGLNFIPSKKPV